MIYPTKSEVQEALRHVRNNDAKAFFSMFFGYWESDNDVELETWTDGGVNMFAIFDTLYFEQDWKEEFIKYVDNFDIDEEIELHRENEGYCNNFTIEESVEDFKEYKKWLCMLCDLINNKTIQGSDESTLEAKYEPFFKTCVLTFNKTNYTRDEVQGWDDQKKYQIAQNDNENCKVYTSEEYCNALNAFIPMDKYVLTYIVNVREGGGYE